MAFIRYKTLGDKRYAYEVTSYWDTELKQSRNKSKYLGAVDNNTNEITQFIKKPREVETLLLDFGNGYFLNQFIKNSEFYPALEKSLFDYMPELLPLMAYKISTQSAMRNCQDWLNGNVLQVLHKDTNLISQRISDILNTLGREDVQRKFFKEYLQIVGTVKKSVIIDATCMPTEINHQFNSWGKSDGGLKSQFKLLCVVDQNTKLPLFYRFLPGNMTDISTLQTTIAELSAMGIENNSVLLDSGYFSESNLNDLYTNSIHFITRIPNGRAIFKNNVKIHASTLDNVENIYLCGERTIFIKKLKIDLYGKRAYLYLLLDPVKKAKDVQELMYEYSNLQRKTIKDKESYNNDLISCGIIGLISSKSIATKEILSCYYLRQSVEQVFGFLKDDLGLLPIRQHNDATVRGYLFLQFIALIIYIKIREKLEQKYTVEKILMILSGLKCKVFTNQVIPAELTKEQKLILKNYDILVPKFLGI